MSRLATFFFMTSVFHPVSALLLNILVVSSHHCYNSGHLTHKNLCLLLRFFLGQSPGVAIIATKCINLFKDLRYLLLTCLLGSVH